MDDGSRLSFIVAAVLILCAMYFALVETAFASVSQTKLKTDQDRGDNRAKKALWITDNFDRAVTTILICTNIIHLTAASVVTVAVTRIWGMSAVTISTLLITLLMFFFGEMLPKSIAKKYSEHICLATAGSLRLFMIILQPLSAFLTMIGKGVSRLAKREPEASVTEEELYDIIEDMAEEGSLDEEQSDLISSALQFGDVTAESVLTSRVDLVAVDIEKTPDEILELIKKETHTRIPVYSGSVDNIIGILQIRTFIKEYLHNKDHLDLGPLLDEPYFVHSSIKIDELLSIMSRKKLNMAVITDNFGGTRGIITVEDILEELVGEIWDEDDVAMEPIQRIGEDLYEVDSQETLGDVLDELDLEVDDEDDEELTNKLMGELAYEQFSRIPQEGDQFEYAGMQITVSAMEHNRILMLQVRKLAPSDPEDGEEDEA